MRVTRTHLYAFGERGTTSIPASYTRHVCFLFPEKFFLLCVSQSRGARSRRFPKRYSTHGRAAKVAGMAGVEPAFSVPIIHVPGRNRCNYTPKKWWSRQDSHLHGLSAHNFSGYGGYYLRHATIKWCGMWVTLPPDILYVKEVSNLADPSRSMVGMPGLEPGISLS